MSSTMGTYGEGRCVNALRAFSACASALLGDGFDPSSVCSSCDVI